jgi:hypothetical protein
MGAVLSQPGTDDNWQNDWGEWLPLAEFSNLLGFITAPTHT